MCVPSAFFLPNTEARALVRGPHSVASGTCPLPFPLQPCSGTTLALTTWGFCTTPCWFPKFHLHLGSPFVRLFSNYLLLMYHLILAGALNETPTDSAVSIFNIY